MRTLFLLSLLSSTLLLYSQDYYFERISTQHGLSQNDVLDIFQDSRGYLWIATNDGLNRYDGLDFKVFKTSNNDSNTISSNLIVNIVEDLNSNLWIATQDKGISRFDLNNGKFTNFYNRDGQKNILQSNLINSVYCDSKNRIWISNYYGIDCIIQSGNSFDIYNLKGIHDSISKGLRQKNYSITEGSNGHIYVSMKYGIATVRFSSDQQTPLSLEPYLFHSLVQSIKQIHPIENGFITNGSQGISYVPNKLNVPGHNIKPYNIGRVEKLILSDKNIIWAGSNKGLYRIEFDDRLEAPFKITHKFMAGEKKHNLSNDYIRSLTKDHTGIIWIGTSGSGICKYSALSTQFRLYKQTENPGSLSKNKVLAIYEDDNKNVWIGTEGGGANYLPFEHKKNYSSGFKVYYTEPIPKEQNTVYDFETIRTNPQHEIWMGTGYKSRIASLKETYEDEWKLTRSQIPIARGNILTICKDEFDAIWMGSYKGGIFRAKLINGKYKVQQFDMSNSNICSEIVRNIIEDSKGRLWIGTTNGLMVLNREQKKLDTLHFKIFQFEINNDSSLAHNFIVPIIESQDNIIWIGTIGGGLLKYIEGDSWNNGWFQSFNTSDGFPNNSIKEIIEDDNGELWIGTNRGLSRFAPQTKTITNYTIKDGLQDYEFGELAGTKLHDGEILIGGPGGFNAFYPDKIKKDTTPPMMVFKSLKIIDKPIQIGEYINDRILLKKSLNQTEELILKRAENNFSIDFAALHYAKPPINQYKYRLTGYDKDWVHTSANSRFAKYTNLDHGKYEFQLLASNSDGFWALSPKTIKIIITPAYWETVWFRLCIVFVLIVLVIAGYSWKLDSIKKLNKRLEELVQQRTIELIEINEDLQEANEEIVAQRDEILKQRNELEYHKSKLENIINQQKNGQNR